MTSQAGVVIMLYRGLTSICSVWLLLLGLNLLPICASQTVAVCPDPPVIGNGYVTSQGPYQDGERVTYTCQSSYTMVGEADGLFCDSGVWAGTRPNCTSYTINNNYSETNNEIPMWILVGLGALLALLFLIIMVILLVRCCTLCSNGGRAVGAGDIDYEDGLNRKHGNQNGPPNGTKRIRVSTVNASSQTTNTRSYVNRNSGHHSPDGNPSTYHKDSHQTHRAASPGYPHANNTVPHGNNTVGNGSPRRPSFDQNGRLKTPKSPLTYRPQDKVVEFKKKDPKSPAGVWMPHQQPVRNILSLTSTK